MSLQTVAQTHTVAKPPITPVVGKYLQRACACGQHVGNGGECEECKKKRLGMLQRSAVNNAPINSPARKLQAKLAINKTGDEYEQEADRIADEVMAMPVNHSVSNAPPRIQRFVQQSTEQMNAAPASVDQALASCGSPLEPSLQRDMEQRFDYDFSQVRVHTDSKAAESAVAVNALAYTVGRDVVFARGMFKPDSSTGKRLLAHELGHTIQQGAASRRENKSQFATLTASPSLAKKDAPQSGPSHKANDPNQLKSELHPTGKVHLFADQVASIYFGTKSYVPDQDDHKILNALAKEYQYMLERKGGLRGKVIGHADVELSSNPDNQELSFQRARWTAAALKFHLTELTKGTATNLQFETEGNGTGYCMGDPDCKSKRRPDTLALYRRADIMIFTEKMPSPSLVACPPVSGAGVKTIGEYIELIRCSETKTGYSPTQMLALLRQMYYGKPWSATTRDPNWDFVIPCSPNLGHPKDKLGQPLFDALYNTVTIEGIDLGHVFTGLEAMTCPASEVKLEKSKFGVGIELTVAISNESFATWGGDVGSAAGAMVACWMMSNAERATKGKDNCHQGDMPESLEQYFVKRLAPPADLEGDIAPFVIRAAQSPTCAGTLEKKFTPQAPISTVFMDFFLNRGPSGRTSKNRYLCFAEIIGAKVVDGKITNRPDLHRQYQRGVLSFAWAYYVNLKKEIPRSDPVVQLLDRNSTAALNLFFDWLQARMSE
jgi:outer membrane protein OmpA-like peptidoglycan-associated protein